MTWDEAVRRAKAHTIGQIDRDALAIDYLTVEAETLEGAAKQLRNRAGAIGLRAETDFYYFGAFQNMRFQATLLTERATEIRAERERHKK